MRGVKAFTGAAAAALLLAFVGPMPALADTIEAALVRAYQNNPQLNAQRAQVRSTDENVPQALSGYRPKVAVTASAGYQYTDTLSTPGGTPTTLVRTEYSRRQSRRAASAPPSRRRCSTASRPRTGPARRRARSPARAKRLRVLEQTVLLSAATIYMDYLRDSAIVEVQKSNVRVLEQTLKQTRDRFNVGEVTRTDVAQSEAQLAAGKTQLLTAEANLTTTRSNFRRIIGNEPEALAPGSPVDRFLPATLPASVELGLTQNPNVTAAMFGIDVSYLQVKVNEGALLPTVTFQASVQQSYEQTLTILPVVRRVGDRAAFGPDLSGRRRIFADPPVQGNAGAAASRSRTDPRPDPRQRRHGMGAAGGRQGAGAVRPGAGARRPKSRSTACARKPRPDSAPRSTC